MEFGPTNSLANVIARTACIEPAYCRGTSAFEGLPVFLQALTGIPALAADPAPTSQTVNLAANTKNSGTRKPLERSFRLCP